MQQQFIFFILLGFLLCSCSDNKDPLTRSKKPEPGKIFALAKPQKVTQDTTLFTQLTPETTGVSFKNHLKDYNIRNYLTNGAGVAVGDYDLDGRPDIFFVCQDGPNRLYRQKDNLVFEDATEKAKIPDKNTWGTGATFVDIDNDRDLDLYICNMKSANELYINNGDGTFTEQAAKYNLDYKGMSVMAAFADYDRDGDLDMYLVTNRLYKMKTKLLVRYKDGEKTVHPDFVDEYYFLEGRMQEAGEKDYLYINNGNGTFSDVSENTGMNRGHYMGLSATWWDYNGDLWPDLYVGNDMRGPDHLYRNNQDGTFTDVIEELVPSTTWFSMGADFGDINNDGVMDFLIADMANTTHYKQKTMMGAMTANYWFFKTAHPPQNMRNTLFLGTKVERFWEVAYLSGMAKTDWTWAVKMGDYDNDGFLDAFFTNGIAREYNDSDWNNRFNDLMDQGKVFEARELVFQMKPMKEQNFAFRNTGDIKFKDTTKEWGLDFTGISQSAALSDLDRDGDLDLIVSNFKDNAIIYRNNSTKNSITIHLAGNESNSYGVGTQVSIKTKDQQQTRMLMLARGYLSSNEPHLHFGLGETSQIDEMVISWPSGQVQTLKNLPANNLYFITEPNNQKPEPKTQPKEKPLFTEIPFVDQHKENEFDDFAKQPLLPNTLSRYGPGVAIGSEAVFVGGAKDQAGRVYLKNNLEQPISGPWEQDARSEDMGAVWVDLDSNGKEDLYVVSGGNEYSGENPALLDRLYWQNDNGTFTKATTETLPSFYDSGSCVAVSDFDQDGDLDLFCGNRFVPGKFPHSSSSRLLQNNNGKFQDIANQHNVHDLGLVTSAVWSDTNQDSWPDLWVTTEWGTVRYFQNQQGQLVEQTQSLDLAKLRGWWNGITPCDVDQDGDWDYIVTNFGWNTKYKVDEKHEAYLYYDDFDRNGTMDLVEANWEDEICYPVRGLSCSSTAMPFIREKFPTYKSFAQASLQEIYSKKSLENAPYKSVNCLTSGIWIQEQGKFTFQPLPNLAQASPAFGVVVADWIGDSGEEIYLTHNFYHPQIETSKMTGGLSLLLENKGSGNFTSIPPHRSGLVVPGDARALARGDWNQDGIPDLVITQNGDKSRLFTFQEVKSQKQHCTVKLEGLPGNPSGIGSTVTLHLTTGEKQIREVRTGGSYLSQDSPALFFTIPKGAQIKSWEVLWSNGQKEEYQQEFQKQIIFKQAE